MFLLDSFVSSNFIRRRSGSLRIFHWSASDSNSHVLFETFLCILPDLTSDVVRIIWNIPWIFSWPLSFTDYLRLFQGLQIWLQLLSPFIIKRFIVISTTFRSICPLPFFRCLSNSGTFTELQTTSFIEPMGVACSDSVSHNQIQVFSILVLLLACSQDWNCNLQMIVSLEA